MERKPEQIDLFIKICHNFIYGKTIIRRGETEPVYRSQRDRMREDELMPKKGVYTPSCEVDREV